MEQPRQLSCKTLEAYFPFDIMDEIFGEFDSEECIIDMHASQHVHLEFLSPETKINYHCASLSNCNHITEYNFNDVSQFLISSNDVNEYLTSPKGSQFILLTCDKCATTSGYLEATPILNSLELDTHMHSFNINHLNSKLNKHFKNSALIERVLSLLSNFISDLNQFRHFERNKLAKTYNRAFFYNLLTEKDNLSLPFLSQVKSYKAQLVTIISKTLNTPVIDIYTDGDYIPINTFINLLFEEFSENDKKNNPYLKKSFITSNALLNI